MSISAILMAVALLGAEPDGVVATAPATSVDLEATTPPAAPSVAGAVQAAVPHGLSTDQQIDRWIESRSTADAPWAEAAPGPLDDRKMHGQVRFGIGTGGYRDFGAAVSLPIGETGRLDFSYREVKNGYPYGRFGDYGYGDPWYNDGDYAFPGYRPGPAARFEGRLMRPDGPFREREDQPAPPDDR
jgi:hypothetical protein